VNPIPTADNESMLVALRAERNRFVAFAFAASDLVLEVGRDGVITYAAGASNELFGVDADQLHGESFFGLLAPDDRASVRSAFEAVGAGTRSLPLAARVIGQDGRVHGLSLRAYRLPETGDGVFVSIRRGNESENNAPTLRFLRDQTGVLETEGFSQVVSRRLAAARAGDTPLALTLIDMDGASGDAGKPAGAIEPQLMREVANLLRQRTSGSDDIGRLGDGKFGIVHEAGQGFGSIAAEIEALAKPARHRACKIVVHAHVVDLDDGLNEPDSARAVLYTLNKFSDARPGAFSLGSLSEACRAMFAETLQWSSRIRRTIGERRFSLAFQPIVDMANRRTHHFEALLRLPEGRDVTPYKFVTMAEQLGSIAELDLAVAERVIGVLRAAPTNRDSIAINVSGRSLVTPGFVDALIGQIRRNADLAPRLLFEVTESAKIVDLNGVNRALQTLRQYKVRVCLDDFGAGAAAFEYLRSLNVDILKIDGSFIRDAAASTFNRAFIRSIASLCDGLGIATIAEMIEDETTARVVREAGVTHGQGYLYGRPETLGSLGPQGDARVIPTVQPAVEHSLGG
jgi:PAS domain S-box-containing protein